MAVRTWLLTKLTNRSLVARLVVTAIESLMESSASMARNTPWRPMTETTICMVGTPVSIAKCGALKKIEDKSTGDVGVKFSLTSKDGDEGYPGTLKATVVYYLTDEDELVIEYSATTDAPTHVNLTNHNYWNLSGDHSKKILDHELKIEADQFLEPDDSLIPTGKLLDVKGTPFDFIDFHTVGERIEQLTTDPQGYDHCFALRGTDKMHAAATVRDPSSGRVMEITTTEPGIQFYSGNFLDGEVGSGGFTQYTAFCLETQKYPDTPNQPEFPTSMLRPGETYSHKTVHKFSVTK